jgi:hypothetical protein
MRELGFRDAAVLAYWDVCFGLLHPVDFLFVGVK